MGMLHHMWMKLKTRNAGGVKLDSATHIQCIVTVVSYMTKTAKESAMRQFAEKNDI